MDRALYTLVTDVESGTVLRRRVRVVVEEGPDAGTERALEGTLLVGTHPDADLVLTDGRVSRRHLELALVADGVRVRDLGSKNGVSHGKVRLDAGVVPPGARLHVGRTVLRLDAVDEDLAVPEATRFGDLTTESPTMRATFGLLQLAAGTDVTVLLEGETGVGKDRLARALHQESARRAGPFVVLDGGALAPGVLSSELFGHKKGAFTGAEQDRAGVFEAAQGGTLFLDEVGELPLDVQPALLRALESREVRRVGESQPRAVDVRLVAATHRDLVEEIEAGRFRRDLFYRLAVVRVRVPPLRERREDLPALVQGFLGALGCEEAADPDELALLAVHPWPGNVRELRNLVAQAVALRGAGPLRLLDRVGPMYASSSSSSSSSGPGNGELSLADEVLGKPYHEARAQVLEAFEVGYVSRLLRAAGGNVSKAARDAGVDRNYIYRLLRKHGLDREALG